MPDYYILGSKRLPDGKHWEDRLPDMATQKLLEVGWGWNRGSFAHLYGRPEVEIVAALKRKGEGAASYNAHKLFLNLRPGDWVAIKKHGAPQGTKPVLAINAYARVVQRNGIVYRRGEPPLGHCINAEFLEVGEEHKFRLGYGATIHRLTNPQHIRQVFAPIFGQKKRSLKVTPPKRKAQWRRRAALLAAVEDQIRRLNAKHVTARQTHHRIRNKLYKQLVNEHGEGKVLMEQDWIDLRVDADKSMTLYEIKPYQNVLHCVREGLGQILSYAWREKAIQPAKIKLIVVGPNAPTKEESEFIAFVRRTVKIDFDYLPFH